MVRVGVAPSGNRPSPCSLRCETSVNSDETASTAAAPTPAISHLFGTSIAYVLVSNVIGNLVSECLLQCISLDTGINAAKLEKPMPV